MRQRFLVFALLLSASIAHATAPPGKPRYLTPSEQKELNALHERLSRHTATGEFEQAANLAAQIGKFRQSRQGARHWQTIDARHAIAFWKRQMNVPAKDRADIARAMKHDDEAFALFARQQFSEAEQAFRLSLSIRARSLGNLHADTGLVSLNLASCFFSQKKTLEAVALFRQALFVLEKALGEDHPDTALALSYLAQTLLAQEKVAEALPLYRRELSILEKSLGKYHPRTARGYDSLGRCLLEQNRPAEAEPFYRLALEVRVSLFGKDHFASAQSYQSVASCLIRQGKIGEAEPLLRHSFQIAERTLPPDHPALASSCVHLAFCLRGLSKHSEAMPLFRRSLVIKEKAFGPNHPSTAQAYNLMGGYLIDLQKRTEALSYLRKALQIWERGHGREHPNTVIAYSNTAYALWLMLRHNEAMHLWQQAVRGHEVNRAMRADTGFDRAFGDTQGISPHAALAIALAGFGQPRNAFRHAESSLARALLDDSSSLTSSEQARSRQIDADMRRLESVIAAFARSVKLTEEQRAQHERTKKQYGELSRELTDLYVAASQRAILPLERIQKAIPEDSALVLWIEELFQSWACVVRPQGPPRWQLLEGGHVKLSQAFYATLTDTSSDERTRQKLLTEFRKGRFDRLRPHLKGVKRLFVVPTNEQARVPADLLADDFVIRYVPSGSVFARMMENHRPFDGSSLLAVGDPVFDLAPPPEPPTHGVFVEAVLPESNAARAGLQPGDVLLSIGKMKLASHDDLAAASRLLPANADVWRDGKTFTVRLQGTTVDAVLSKRAVRVAILAWRGSNPSARRGTGHKRLPGTRLEVEAIAPMVKKSQRLLGSEASEQKFDVLLSSGELKGYRILHIATHGEANEQAPGRSALILAQDRLPNPLEQAKAGLHVYDGRLTVSRIRTEWKDKLDADLVVLSACETGLGKDAKGDGLLGFAQAFLSIGARSVILSRWKVDDTATSLLMIRFYENLLGKRKGVKAMGRAAALDEAKKWLRTLPRKEAERLAILHTDGVLRGSEGIEKPAGKAKPVEYKGDTPFAHPCYWAAFTLIGDPD